MARRTVNRLCWIVLALAALVGCGTGRPNAVTVYVSEDQVFSGPILKDFERETGITVNAVFDTEEAKSTGVMNRLLAEKNNPQADVYWANEPVRADVLQQQGISAPYKPVSAAEIPERFKDPQGNWTGFSARTRLLVVNNAASIKPASVLVASFTQASAFYNFGAATAAAMPMIAVVLVGLLAIESVFHRKTYSFRWGGQLALGPIPLGPNRPFVLMAVVALAVILVGMPLGGVLWRGVSITALRDRRSVAGWRSLDALTLFLSTLPETVIGIGLIALWNHPSTNWIYATPAILIIGFIAQYAALSVRIIVAGFAQVSPSLEEAAEVAGVGWFRRVFGILVPVARPVLVAAWRLPVAIRSPGRTMTLMANGSPELIAALCVLAALLALLPLGALGLAWCAWSRPA